MKKDAHWFIMAKESITQTSQSDQKIEIFNKKKKTSSRIYDNRIEI